MLQTMAYSMNNMGYAFKIIVIILLGMIFISLVSFGGKNGLRQANMEIPERENAGAASRWSQVLKETHVPPPCVCTPAPLTVPQPVTNDKEQPYAVPFRFADAKLYMDMQCAMDKCTMTRFKPQIYLCALEGHDTISKIVRDGVPWETGVSLALLKALEKYKPAMLVDIGTHIGAHSLRIASHNYTVLSVEPSPEQLPLFIRGVLLNGFEDRLTLLPYAVSDKRQTVTMIQKGANNGHSFIASDLPMSTKWNYTTFETTTIMLDDLIPFVDLNKNIILKIDVEGHECKVLNPNSELFTKGKIQFIVMECVFGPMLSNKEVGQPCLHTMFDTLIKLGFEATDRANGQIMTKEEVYRGYCPHIEYIWRKKDDY